MKRLALAVMILLGGKPGLAAENDSPIKRHPAEAAKTGEKPSPSRSEYQEWVESYTVRQPFMGWFPETKGSLKMVQVPLKLVVTSVEDLDQQAGTRKRTILRQISRGSEVAADGRVCFFHWYAFGSGSGGYPLIPDADRKRLDQMLANLPDDGARLPPSGRRLVLQVPEGDRFRARVYDRANAPDEIWEVLRRSLCRIRSWVPEFASVSELRIGPGDSNGFIALTPGGQLVSAVADGPLRFWDAGTHKLLKDSHLPCRVIPEAIKFSPDGSLAVLTGKGGGGCCVLDAKTWKVVREFQEPRVGRHVGVLRFPQFTADGRLLLFLCSQPDAEGNRTILPRAYNTRTWERYDKLPGLPDSALTSIEEPTGRRAVVLLKGNVVALWDNELRRQYAKLDDGAPIDQVAFSPDGSMVAIATKHKEVYGGAYRLRLWKMRTGELVHELGPLERRRCESVTGLQWTADGRYVLAATNGQFSVNIWSVLSGRHRGSLVGDSLNHATGVVVSPDGRHVAAGAAAYPDSKVSFWDLAAALNEIRAFEDSLAKPDARCIPGEQR